MIVELKRIQFAFYSNVSSGVTVTFEITIPEPNTSVLEVPILIEQRKKLGNTGLHYVPDAQAAIEDAAERLKGDLEKVMASLGEFLPKPPDEEQPS